MTCCINAYGNHVFLNYISLVNNFLTKIHFKNPNENQRKTRLKHEENPKQTRGKPQENPRKTRRKPGENPGKTSGKPGENPRKTRRKTRVISPQKRAIITRVRGGRMVFSFFSFFFVGWVSVSGFVGTIFGSHTITLKPKTRHKHTFIPYRYACVPPNNYSF